MKEGNTMQEKRTLYLAGKITGDPYYFTKFYNAQKKLEEGGFIVVNPAHLPAEGVKAGVPDLCLPVARGQYHGLYIELKRQRGGRTSDHQSEWLDAISAQGYKAALCYGWEQAAGTIIEYLTGGGTHD